MNIEEAIEILKQEPDFSLNYYNRENAIDVLLTAYEKEKEKNNILLQCLKDSQERCKNEHLFLGNPNM